MKTHIIKTIFFAGIMFLISCGENEQNIETKTKKEIVTTEKNPIKAGENLFTDKGCTACHQPEDKIIGPSIKDVAIAYENNADGMKAFLREEGEAIVEPELFPTMQVNLAITKAMNDEDLNALIEFIMSHK